MGILSTRWEGEHEGHTVRVLRSELTKGFAVEWDGAEIARRSWSWIGLGELRGTADVDGRAAEVHVTIEWGGLSDLNGKCEVHVDGKKVPVERVQ